MECRTEECRPDGVSDKGVSARWNVGQSVGGELDKGVSARRSVGQRIVG